MARAIYLGKVSHFRQIKTRQIKTQKDRESFALSILLKLKKARSDDAKTPIASQSLLVMEQYFELIRLKLDV